MKTNYKELLNKFNFLGLNFLHHNMSIFSSERQLQEAPFSFFSSSSFTFSSFSSSNRLIQFTLQFQASIAYPQHIRIMFIAFPQYIHTQHMHNNHDNRICSVCVFMCLACIQLFLKLVFFLAEYRTEKRVQPRSFLLIGQRFW